MPGAGARSDTGWVLRVDGISFEANHGAFAPERRTRRRFEVDLEVRAPLDRPAASDRLADTIDYWKVSEIVVRLGTTSTFKLLEALAGAMAAAIAELYPDCAITIDLDKLAPPCPGVPASCGVRITRRPAT